MWEGKKIKKIRRLFRVVQHPLMEELRKLRAGNCQRNNSTGKFPRSKGLEFQYNEWKTIHTKTQHHAMSQIL